jgi:hypothetical protein
LIAGLEVAPQGNFVWAAVLCGSAVILQKKDSGIVLIPTGKNPKKWSQFFSTVSNYAVCDPEDGQDDTDA